jgi:hypothetical protein
VAALIRVSKTQRAVLAGLPTIDAFGRLPRDRSPWR